METPKTVLSGPIGSRNVGEEFIRVDQTTDSDSPFITRKTGFVPIKAGTYEAALKMIQEGKVKLQFGSQTRNGVFNISLVNPLSEATLEAGVASNAQPAAAGAPVLQHTA